VAVIDSGVDLDHPDLNVFRRGARNCSASGVSANDQNGHGTHVAGTVGALDNRRGVVGTAPGARIWPVRVLGRDGSGTMSSVICGIDYVTRHAAQIEVANMSLGGSGGREDGSCGRRIGDSMHQAICASVAAGVTYVVAAGNDAQDASLSMPSAYHEVITVSAIADFNGRPRGRGAATCVRDVDDTFANFSNFGRVVDLTAPGVCIRSTWLNGRYATISGTSMASPHVAGGAALYLARHPRARPPAVRAALRRTGSTAWNDADDPDSVQEPLLNLSRF
jgi:subtilisin family serine protease